MIRRNETEKSYSFEEIVGQMVYWSEFDLVNILLYYMSKGETDNDKCIKAKARLAKISAEERARIIGWWSNVNLVGEEESKLALSLIDHIE